MAHMSNQNLDQMYDNTLKQMLRDYQAATTPDGRSKAWERGIKSLRSLGVNEAVTNSLEKLTQMPAEKLDNTVQLILNLAQGQATKRQEAEQQRALLEMNVFSADTKAAMSIVSFGSLISTIAKYFGADDFAREIDQKTAEIKANLQNNIQVDTSEIGSGSGEMHKGLQDVLKLITDTSIMTTAQNVAEGAQSQDIVDPMKPYQDSLNKVDHMSRQDFQTNLSSMGLSQTEMDAAIKAFDSSSAKTGNATDLERGDLSKFQYELKKGGIDTTTRTRIVDSMELALS